MDKKENEIKFVNIDKEVLKVALGDKANKSISDPTLFNRVKLNFFAEMLSLLHDNNVELENVVEKINVCTYEKSLDFFAKTKDNIEKEQKKAKAGEIVKMSHQKPKK